MEDTYAGQWMVDEPETIVMEVVVGGESDQAAPAYG